jgi:hypothetical protein
MSSEEIEETCNKIIAWLSQEGLFKESVQDENLSFHLAAEFPARSGRHVNVIQPKGREDVVIVFSRIRLADMHKKALHAMPPKTKERLLWEMRYALLFQESSFEMEPPGGDLEGIRFSREIYYDGLTKNKLMEALRENLKCELFVVWKFQEVFGEGQVSKQGEPPEPMYR